MELTEKDLDAATPKFIKDFMARLNRGFTIRNQETTNYTIPYGMLAVISGKAVQYKANVGNISTTDALVGSLAHEYAHLALFSISGGRNQLQQIHYEGFTRANNAAQAKNWTIAQDSFTKGRRDGEAAVALKLGLDALTLHKAPIPIHAPNARDVYGEVIQIINDVTGGDPSRILSERSIALAAVELVTTLLVSNGLDDKAMHANYIQAALGKMQEISSDSVPPLSVPASIATSQGQADLTQDFFGAWLTQVLKDHNIDPRNVKVNVVFIETSIGRTANIVFESIQEGSARNDFARFDPWMRGNAWQSIHDHWEKTSLSNKIRNNVDLQSGTLLPGSDSEDAETNADSGPGFDFPKPEFMDQTDRAARLLIQSMAGNIHSVSQTPLDIRVNILGESSMLIPAHMLN
jgi:hypothetical protein